MSLIRSTHINAPALALASPAPAVASMGSGLSSGLTLLLSIGAGLSVASLYYSQPMLGMLGEDLGAGPKLLGLVPTMTLLGYALGILFTAPLGDRQDRRQLILTKLVVLVLSLLGAALSPSVHVLLAASLAIGVAASMAQDIVPAAATLAPEAQRGRIVGTVMTGLLLGILLGRVVVGFTAEYLGWRAVFSGAALLTALLGVALWRYLPSFKPTSTLGYGALLRSLLSLVRQHRSLRRAALAQSLLAAGFSAVWTTLAIWLHGAPFHLGASAAGAFGIAGAIGAMAAPMMFGRLAERRGAHTVTQVGSGIAVISFAALAATTSLPRELQLVWLAVAVLGFNLGFQAALISHQTLVYAIDAAARSRLNAVLFVAMFIGMSVGAALSSLLLAWGGWTAVGLLATAGALLALLVRAWPGTAAR